MMNAEMELQLKAARDSSADARLFLGRAANVPDGNVPRGAMGLAAYHLEQGLKLLTDLIEGNAPATAPTMDEQIAQAKAQIAERSAK